MNNIRLTILSEHEVTKVESLSKRLMWWSSGWIVEAETGYKSCLNPNGAEKGGIGILLASKYSRQITTTGSLMNNRVVWIKLGGM